VSCLRTNRWRLTQTELLVPSGWLTWLVLPILGLIMLVMLVSSRVDALISPAETPMH
jgi:hypothetical protein